MTFILCLAWLLPISTGVALYLAVDVRPAAGRVAAAFGYGAVIGLLAAAAATALCARSRCCASAYLA